jgi:FAD/FMN-containing dehydrogenase
MIERVPLPKYLQRIGQPAFKNVHGTVTFSPAEVVSLKPEAGGSERYQQTVRDVCQVLGDALAAGKRVRCLGRRWSISPIAVTDGWLLDLSDVSTAKWLAPDELGAAAASRTQVAYVLLGAGSSVRWFNWAAHRAGWSIQTSGASNGQAIAGAIATGSHGSSFHIGAIHDTVHAMHVVVSPTEHWWVEPARAPLVADQFAASLGARLVRDDDLFAALQTSLGSLGLVVGVVLECVPNFWLDLQRYSVPAGTLPVGKLSAADLIDRLGKWQFAQLAGKPIDRIWHVDAVFNPFKPDSQSYLSAYVLTDRPPRGTPAEVTGEHRGDEWNPDLLQFVSRTLGGIPGAPAVVTRIGLESEYAKPVTDSPRVWGAWFAQQDLPGGALGSSMGVDCAQLEKAMGAILETVQKDQKVPCVVATRFVRGSASLLAMNRLDRTCMIDMDGANIPAMSNLITACCNRLEEVGVPFTMHWGKWNGWLTRDRVNAVYGDRARRWRDARARLLTDPGVAQALSNPLIDALL